MLFNVTRKTFDENLQKLILNICTFSDYDISKFILLLHKDIYPYECMDDWNYLKKTLLHEKKILTVT